MSIKKMYECSSCNEVHDYEWAAEECCQPEVYEVWQCSACTKVHGEKAEAESCCSTGPVKCPACVRDYSPSEIAATAIQVAGHCQTCNPFYTPDQLHEIERQHKLLNNVIGCSLARGESGLPRTTSRSICHL